jgi:hypothetical protein
MFDWLLPYQRQADDHPYIHGLYATFGPLAADTVTPFLLHYRADRV